jgi:hypothetical protein
MLANALFGVSDIARSTKYYDAVFAPLGYKRVLSGEKFIGYSDTDKTKFYICLPANGEPASVGNGSQVSVVAKDKEAVDAFYAAALKHGGSDEGKPGYRPPDKFGPGGRGAAGPRGGVGRRGLAPLFEPVADHGPLH